MIIPRPTERMIYFFRPTKFAPYSILESPKIINYLLNYNYTNILFIINITLFNVFKSTICIFLFQNGILLNKGKLCTNNVFQSVLMNFLNLCKNRRRQISWDGCNIMFLCKNHFFITFWNLTISLKLVNLIIIS